MLEIESLEQNNIIIRKTKSGLVATAGNYWHYVDDVPTMWE